MIASTEVVSINNNYSFSFYAFNSNLVRGLSQLVYKFYFEKLAVDAIALWVLTFFDSLKVFQRFIKIAWFLIVLENKFQTPNEW